MIRLHDAEYVLAYFFSAAFCNDGMQTIFEEIKNKSPLQTVITVRRGSDSLSCRTLYDSDHVFPVRNTQWDSLASKPKVILGLV